MRAGVVALCLSLGGCAQPQLTEILVVADTDLAVPSELARVRFRVAGPGGQEQVALADFAAGDPRPAVLALVHRGGALGPFIVDVAGERAPGEVVVERGASVQFVPGEVLVLPMHLLAQCVDARCGELETCGEGGCRSRAIDPSELSTWDGDPPRVDPRTLDAGADASADRDAGTDVDVDAGRHAGVDATVDARVDSGVDVDAGCASDADCDDGVDCTVDVCAAGACASTPDGSRCEPDAHGCTSQRCDATAGCVTEVEHALCDDSVDCTVDRCDADAGCVFEPADSLCDDGVVCTVDRCDALLGCASTADDARCTDGIGCTTDRCDAVLGCLHAPDDAVCDDGVDCNIDACDPAIGCTWWTSAASCPLGERCDTSARACLPGATFTQVYAFLSRDCVGTCHDAGADGGLDLSSRALAYASLVGVVSTCGGGANTRVIARDVRRSLLWRKVARVDLCGLRMPPSGPPGSSSDVALIESWIASGALDN